MEAGPNKSEQLIEVQFKKTGFDYSRVAPGPGIFIDNFGDIRFSPAVKLGKIQSEEIVGSCIRVCESSNSVNCVDNVTEKSCDSQDAFGNRPRCPVTLSWNQNLSCVNASRLVD